MRDSPTPLYLGLDFGTESVRAVIQDRRGRLLGSAVVRYRHGQIVAGSSSARSLFADGLRSSFALQHPQDWLDSAAAATNQARGSIDSSSIVGIGVSFTSCTVLPCRADGTPLCQERWGGAHSSLAEDPHAWPKLWKHHGALSQTDRLNAIARARREPWLGRYGGVIGLEWLFPKILEVMEASPRAADAAEVWIEGGDWLVWQLVGAPAAGGDVDAPDLPRSTCQAGYKGLWSDRDGWPADGFLAAVHDGLIDVKNRKLAGRLVPPGQRAGRLSDTMAQQLGLQPGVAVSAAVIDAHAGVPGAGVGEAGTLVMVLGTSGCHMLLDDTEKEIPGVAGVVKDGILPGYYGYETGQAAMGDAFDLVRSLSGAKNFTELDRAVQTIPPGARGVRCVDWFNGCRTPLMDGSLTGGFLGVRLDTTSGQLYRAALESSACGLRWIVDTLRDGGLSLSRFVATGGLPMRNPEFLRVCASVLGEPISVHGSEHGSALGAAILGALAAGSDAGGFDDARSAVAAMAGSDSSLPAPTVIDPVPEWVPEYEHLYREYRGLVDRFRQDDSPLRPRGESPSE